MRRATAAFLTALVLCAVQLAGAPAARAGTKEARALGKAYEAYQKGDFAAARKAAAGIDRSKLVNDDYALYVMAQSAYMLGDYDDALRRFRELARERGSRFREVAGWRIADTLWKLGKHAEARAEYAKLLRGAGKDSAGDPGVAAFRIAESYARTGDTAAAQRRLREFLREHPAHALAARAEARLVELGGPEAAALGPADRIARAKQLKEVKLWHEAYHELSIIGDDLPAATRLQRDYWTAMTLFSMRRQYERAGRILLGLYDKMGSDAPFALFHGARALSRADKDEEAIRYYLQVVQKYRSSHWAAEAQFLAGWLKFNLGKYAEAIPLLRDARRKFPKSKWKDQAEWFEALSHFLLGQYREALPLFETLARSSGALSGGKGHYWKARSLQKLERTDDATAAYRELVGRFPFSWYALLARARLKEQGIDISPFGDAPRSPADNTAIDTKVDERLAKDPLIRGADELLAAGLGIEAGVEMRRGEKAFIKRHKTSAALAILMDRYRKGGDYNRPWMLAVVYGGWKALHAPPEGQARIWWEHAYPQAYRDTIEAHEGLGKNPRHYLYSIMRKESGFNPHTWSYADAIGLLQMIPPTTRRVAVELGLEYTDDLLYDPELNIKTASWYIGNLLHKFKDQIPFGAGSFNSGPRPVMRWLDQNGHRPTDEFVELVSYRQTREYMKLVTESYARYLYLYEKKIYDQPLVVDPNYIKDELTY